MNNHFQLLLILEVVVVLLFSFLFKKLSPTVVGILYFVYSMINGVTLSVIFAVFEMNSIIYLFGVTALVFGALAYIGYNTSKDLSSWRPYLTVFLIAGIVLSIINLILKNSTLDLILDWVILAVFLGVTVYDINKVKLLQESGDFSDDKIHIYCAMQLYLDFINIFLKLLRLFASRKN